MATRFSKQMVAETTEPFWDALQAGAFLGEAAQAAGTNRRRSRRWIQEAGGVRPRRGRDLVGRCLTFGEREKIAIGIAANESRCSIAARLGRSPSTITRELQRNSSAGGVYRATVAHAAAFHRASRPKPAKLATNPVLRDLVELDLKRRFSPEQIAGRLRRKFPLQQEMWVSTETIYQSLYVQSRGALRRDLTACLRTGRALRRPSRKPGMQKNRAKNMLNIVDRPAEADDRAVPGHWEGDLIIGKRNQSAIGTLVERTTGYTMLVHLPDGYKPEQVRDALIETVKTIPDVLRKSLAWDQGPELRDHQQITIDAGIDIYFCDPHSPWQRGTNENTNGLLRQYFPKGTDLSLHTPAELKFVSDELNDRPRKRFAFATPLEQVGPLLLQ